MMTEHHMIDHPRLLDTFCCAGGATKGYQRAGFYVVGVDIEPQPHYCGDEFYQADAFDFIREHGTKYDVIHASPPCQAYSECTPMAYRKKHPDLIASVRAALQTTRRPFVIENVENARALLINPVMLCGSMFGLQVWRHRYFEIYPPMFILTPPCKHDRSPVTLCKAGSNSRRVRRLPVLISGTTSRAYKNGGRFEFTADECRDASGLTWMTRKEMDEAIPPAYTQFVGGWLMRYLGFEPETMARTIA